MAEAFSLLFSLAALVFAVWVIWWLFKTVAEMASRRGQNPTLWVVASLFVNPVVAMLLLWLFVPVVEREHWTDNRK